MKKNTRSQVQQVQEDENSLFLMKLKVVELELEIMKAENKKLQKKHMQELRSRDWREFVILCLFSVSFTCCYDQWEVEIKTMLVDVM
jgi:hypothetical protein